MNNNDLYDDYDPEMDSVTRKIINHNKGCMVIVNDENNDLDISLYLRICNNKRNIPRKHLYLTPKYDGDYGIIQCSNGVEYSIISIIDIITKGVIANGVTLFGWSPFYFRAYINSTATFNHTLESLSIEKHLYNYLYEGVIYLINGTGDLSSRLVGSIYEDDTKLILYLSYTYIFRLTALGFMDLELIPYYKRLSSEFVNNVINCYEDVIIEDAHKVYEFYPELFSQFAHYKSIILVTNITGYEECPLFREIKIDTLITI